MLIFLVEFEISEVAVQRIHQNSEKWWLCEEFEESLNENNFEAVLGTLYFQNYGANTSEAVEKIAIRQNDYDKCSLCVIVC